MPVLKNPKLDNVTVIKSSYAVETWQLHNVKPYEKNARKISEKAIQKVAKSLQEFGWRQPMVVDAEGVLIVGHARRLAAVHLGWTDGPVHVAADLSETQVKAYRLMDNRSHEETAWDVDILKTELFELKGLDIDLSLTGFDLPEIQKLISIDTESDSSGDQTGELSEMFQVLVTCPSESKQAELLEKLSDEGWRCRALIS